MRVLWEEKAMRMRSDVPLCALALVPALSRKRERARDALFSLDLLRLARGAE